MEQKERILTFKILGEEYKIKTDMDKERAVRITNYVNKKIELIAEKVGYASQTKIAVLSALHIAIELFQEKTNNEQIEKQIEKAFKKLSHALEKE
jgi:cell division protein ZapA (FtsZ GTPase activity inhibitor)